MRLRLLALVTTRADGEATVCDLTDGLDDARAWIGRSRVRAAHKRQ